MEEWPAFEPQWDCAPASAHLSLDGCSPEQFAVNYPGGVTCCDVALSELDGALCELSRRSKEEVWRIAGRNDLGDKVAGAIVFWSEGGKMTPAFITVVHIKGEDKIFIAGGNNRLAVLRAKSVGGVKILVEHDTLDRAKLLLPSLRECCGDCASVP